MRMFKQLKKFKYNHSDSKRIIAIGDIHGQFDLLIKLMNTIKFDYKKDFLIFMGDYVDRARSEQDEIDTIEYLIALHNRSKGKVVLLKGNHEIMVETIMPFVGDDSWQGVDQRMWWLQAGAGEKMNWSEKVRNSLVKFCNALPHYYETDTHFFVHAGIKKDIPVANQREEDMFWHRSGNQTRYNGKQLVLGHTPNNDIVITPNKICVDTGAFFNGKLSGYDILNEKEYYAKRFTKS